MKTRKEIPACFWAESKAGYLSTHEKLLLIYLISHPTTNRLGCFHLPLRYMAYDLEWSEQYAQTCFNELIDFNFLVWDPKTEWTYLTDFLDWFPIKNSYQGKYIEQVFNEIPENAIIFKLVLGHLLQIPYLDKLFRQRLINYWKKTSKHLDNDQADKQEYVDVPENSIPQEKRNKEKLKINPCQCREKYHA